MSGRRYTDADRAKARELRENGWGYPRLQRRFGVSKSTLAYWLNGASRQRHLDRLERQRHTGDSGSDRYTPEAIADRRLRAELRRAPCSYCGGEGGTIDHVIPLSAGGADDASNLVSACLACNSSKGSAPLDAWLACIAVRSEFAHQTTGRTSNAA